MGWHGFNPLGYAADYAEGYRGLLDCNASSEHGSARLEWSVLVPDPCLGSKGYPLHRFQRCRVLFPKRVVGFDRFQVRNYLTFSCRWRIITVSGLM